MKSSDTKNNGALASYVAIIKAPAIQVLLMGTGFLLMMLFVYMGVMTSFDNTLFTTLSALGDVHGWKNDVLRDVYICCCSGSRGIGLGGGKEKITDFYSRGSGRHSDDFFT